MAQCFACFDFLRKQQPPDDGPRTDEHVFHGIRWTSHTRCQAQVDGFLRLECRKSDVFVATWPKCGTHWVHKICALILDNPGAFMFPSEFNAWQKGQSWIGFGKGKGKGKGDDLPHSELADPRILATHVPVEFLPRDALAKNCRIQCCSTTGVLHHHWLEPTP
eukprot:TRINITY_DN6189_c0_g1_i8.p1 TRINITY_DN6189_c0_g1~~TRINITY_DN6189_c0_g1_i8.p1  ORF type:complete len:163 (-),score=7.88 TRINITY_DN6189_c0_g1_i8:253-741(-)